MNNKAGAIIRVSTTRQLEGTSPEKQTEKILALADQQGYDIDPNHIWQLAESGGSRERVGFAAALRAGTKGEISRVYVFNIDRLGRDLLEMLLFLRQLEDMGIDCWGAEKGQQLNGNDFLFQIEGAVASKERQEDPASNPRMGCYGPSRAVSIPEASLPMDIESTRIASNWKSTKVKQRLFK